MGSYNDPPTTITRRPGRALLSDEHDDGDERTMQARGRCKPEDDVCCDDVSFLHILRSMKKGRAGGEDGLAVEFAQAMTPEQISALLQLVRETLTGRRAIPAGWRVAHVALIPKIVMACRPGDYRPITVLLVALNITMKVWLHHASDFLTLRRQASRGFRSSFQPAEVHHILRTLIRKHSIWGVSLALCKVGIAKAYDCVTWRAIDEMFRARQLPDVLRHTGRSTWAASFTSLRTRARCGSQWNSQGGSHKAPRNHP